METAGAEPIRIEIAATARAGYDVIVEPGALARLGDLAHAVAPAARYAIIADATVAASHGAAARRALHAHAPAELFTFPPGEAHKTRETWAALTDAMLEAGFRRDACIVALGGGVTGDLAGFVAATYMRGLPWIQVPASLLAMIDASVGGKTGVDVPGGKNLVGAFTQPRVVVADPLLLGTLPPGELRNGLAEAVKHGAIADAGHLDEIRADPAALLAAEPAACARLVRRSVAIKARVVAADPFERGERAILNFGHTVAHAVERITGYAVPHGRAVAIGMVTEARIGEAAGITAAGTAERLRDALAGLDLPTRLPTGLTGSALLDAAASDKKARGARIRWALLDRIGVPARGPAGEWTLEVPDEIVQSVVDS